MVNIITKSSGKLIEISIIDSYLISATDDDDDDDDSSAAIFLPLKSNFNTSSWCTQSLRKKTRKSKTLS